HRRLGFGVDNLRRAGALVAGGINPDPGVSLGGSVLHGGEQVGEWVFHEEASPAMAWASAIAASTNGSISMSAASGLRTRWARNSILPFGPRSGEATSPCRRRPLAAA